jgi:DNA-directed RNA polymerase subunit H (RpoH/RPB5)
MAQVNVKVLEATAGKITEVEFAGAKYVKSEEGVTPEEGDLILALVEGTDVTEGAFYEIIDVDYDEEAFFYDDDNDKQGRYPNEDKNLFFRKTQSFEKFEVGDFARIVNDNEHTQPVVSSHQFKEGELVKVLRTNGTHKDVYYVEDINEEDTWHVHAGDLEKVTAEEAETIKRANTEIEEGDVVRVVKYSAGHQVGTLGVVTRGGKADSVIVTAVRQDGSERTTWEAVELVAKASDRKDN